MTDTVMASAALFGANARANKQARSRRMLIYSVVGVTLLGGLVGVSYYYGNKNLKDAESASGDKAASLRGVGGTGMSAGVLAAVISAGALGFLLLMFYVRRTKTENDADDGIVRNSFKLLDNPKSATRFFKKGGGSEDQENVAKLYSANPEDPGSSQAIAVVSREDDATYRRDSRGLPDAESVNSYLDEYTNYSQTKFVGSAADGEVFFDDRGKILSSRDLSTYDGVVYDSPNIREANVVRQARSRSYDDYSSVSEDYPYQDFQEEEANKISRSRERIFESLSQTSTSTSSSIESYFSDATSRTPPSRASTRSTKSGSTYYSNDSEFSNDSENTSSSRESRRSSLSRTESIIKKKSPKPFVTDLEKRRMQRIEDSVELAKKMGYRPQESISDITPNMRGFGRKFAEEEEKAESRAKTRREESQKVTTNFDKTFVFVYRYLTSSAAPSLGLLPKAYANCFEKNDAGKLQLNRDMFFLAFFSGSESQARKRANELKERILIQKAKEDMDPELITEFRRNVAKKKNERSPNYEKKDYRRKVMKTGEWKNEAELAFDEIYSEQYKTFDDFVDSSDAKKWLKEQQMNAILQKTLDETIPKSAKSFMKSLRKDKDEFEKELKIRVKKAEAKNTFASWINSNNAKTKYREKKANGDIGDMPFETWINSNSAKRVWRSKVRDDEEASLFRTWNRGNKEFKRLLEAFDIYETKTGSVNDLNFLIWYYLNNGKAVVEQEILAEIDRKAAREDQKKEIWEKLQKYIKHDQVILKNNKENYAIEKLATGQKLLRKIDAKSTEKKKREAKEQFEKTFGTSSAVRIGFVRDTIEIVADRYTHMYLRLRGLEQEVKDNKALSASDEKLELNMIAKAMLSVKNTLKKLGRDTPSLRTRNHSNRVYDALTRIYHDKSKWMTARFNISNTSKDTKKRSEKVAELKNIEESLKNKVRKEIESLLGSRNENTADSLAVEESEKSVLENDGRPVVKYI